MRYDKTTLHGRINSDSGNPEICVSGNSINNPVIAVGDYNSFAFYATSINEGFLVLSHYWEGVVPAEMVGTLLQVKRLVGDE